MVAGLRILEQAGARCVVIPCHTAHHWYAELAAATTLPILHIVDAVLAELVRRGAPPGPLGLLATAATLRAGFHQERLGAAGHTCLLPAEEVMTSSVLPAIALVKQDRARAAGVLLSDAVRHLQERGAGLVVLACTELPIALAATDPTPPGCLDATEALARACVEWYREHVG
jgi:aspartate racemase